LKRFEIKQPPEQPHRT